ncbi:Methylated-DNA--protein-cysteine methyltransferase [uncultured archaeon]|nr:Methylated-DNA--protein-cysteine methyltransferase [uncultured archaeon]
MIKNFNNKCYLLLKKVPKGKVVTYKEIARKLGSRAYRAVGNAMHKNCDLINIPCYKVVCSNGSIGGYAKGVQKKIELLKKDRVEVKHGKVDLNKYGYRFI